MTLEVALMANSPRYSDVWISVEQFSAELLNPELLILS